MTCFFPQNVSVCLGHPPAVQCKTKSRNPTCVACLYEDRQAVYTYEIWHAHFLLFIELLDSGLEMPKRAGEVKDVGSSNLSVCSRFTLTAD